MEAVFHILLSAELYGFLLLTTLDILNSHNGTSNSSSHSNHSSKTPQFGNQRVALYSGENAALSSRTFITPRFSCNIKVSCISVWVVEPQCWNGFLEINGRGYLKISLRILQCQAHDFANSTFTIHWLWGSELDYVKELSRCRHFSVCRIPALAVKHSTYRKHWLDILLDLDEGAFTGLISISADPRLIQKDVVLKDASRSTYKKIMKQDNDVLHRNRNHFLQTEKTKSALGQKAKTYFSRKKRAVNEAQDLAVLMQGESPEAREKISEMISSDFASEGFKDPVVAPRRNAGASMRGKLQAGRDKMTQNTQTLPDLIRLRRQIKHTERELADAKQALTAANTANSAAKGGDVVQSLIAKRKAEDKVQYLTTMLKNMKAKYVMATKSAGTGTGRRIHGLVAVSPIWAEWASWSKCSADCGDGGFSVRRRLCETLPDVECPGTSFDMRSCSTVTRCEAQFHEWSDWGPCSVTCGRGVRARSRVCVTGDKEMKCKGPSTMLEKCVLPKCKVKEAALPKSIPDVARGNAAPPVAPMALYLSPGIAAGANFFPAPESYYRPPVPAESSGYYRQAAAMPADAPSNYRPAIPVAVVAGGAVAGGAAGGGSVVGGSVVGGSVVGTGYLQPAHPVMTDHIMEESLSKATVVENGPTVVTHKPAPESKEMEEQKVSTETILFIFLFLLCLLLLIIAFCIYFYQRQKESKTLEKLKETQPFYKQGGDDDDDDLDKKPLGGKVKPVLRGPTAFTPGPDVPEEKLTPDHTGLSNSKQFSDHSIAEQPSDKEISSVEQSASENETEQKKVSESEDVTKRRRRRRRAEPDSETPEAAENEQSVSESADVTKRRRRRRRAEPGNETSKAAEESNEASVSDDQNVSENADVTKRGRRRRRAKPVNKTPKAAEENNDASVADAQGKQGDFTNNTTENNTDENKTASNATISQLVTKGSAAQKESYKTLSMSHVDAASLRHESSLPHASKLTRFQKTEEQILSTLHPTNYLEYPILETGEIHRFLHAVQLQNSKQHNFKDYKGSSNPSVMTPDHLDSISMTSADLHSKSECSHGMLKKYEKLKRSFREKKIYKRPKRKVNKYFKISNSSEYKKVARESGKINRYYRTPKHYIFSFDNQKHNIQRMDTKSIKKILGVQTSSDSDVHPKVDSTLNTSSSCYISTHSASNTEVILKYQEESNLKQGRKLEAKVKACKYQIRDTQEGTEQTLACGHISRLSELHEKPGREHPIKWSPSSYSFSAHTQFGHNYMSSSTSWLSTLISESDKKLNEIDKDIDAVLKDQCHFSDRGDTQSPSRTECYETSQISSNVVTSETLRFHLDEKDIQCPSEHKSKNNEPHDTLVELIDEKPKHLNHTVSVSNETPKKYDEDQSLDSYEKKKEEILKLLHSTSQYQSHSQSVCHQDPQTSVHSQNKINSDQTYDGYHFSDSYFEKRGKLDNSNKKSLLSAEQTSSNNPNSQTSHASSTARTHQDSNITSEGYHITPSSANQKYVTDSAETKLLNDFSALSSVSSKVLDDLWQTERSKVLKGPACATYNIASDSYTPNSDTFGKHQNLSEETDMTATSVFKKEYTQVINQLAPSTSRKVCSQLQKHQDMKSGVFTSSGSSSDQHNKQTDNADSLPKPSSGQIYPVNPTLKEQKNLNKQKSPTLHKSFMDKNNISQGRRKHNDTDLGNTFEYKQTSELVTEECPVQDYLALCSHVDNISSPFTSEVNNSCEIIQGVMQNTNEMKTHSISASLQTSDDNRSCSNTMFPQTSEQLMHGPISLKHDKAKYEQILDKQLENFVDSTSWISTKDYSKIHIEWNANRDSKRKQFNMLSSSAVPSETTLVKSFDSEQTRPAERKLDSSVVKQGTSKEQHQVGQQPDKPKSIYWAQNPESGVCKGKFGYVSSQSSYQSFPELSVYTKAASTDEYVFTEESKWFSPYSNSVSTRVHQDFLSPNHETHGRCRENRDAEDDDSFASLISTPGSRASWKTAKTYESTYRSPCTSDDLYQTNRISGSRIPCSPVKAFSHVSENNISHNLTFGSESKMLSPPVYQGLNVMCSKSATSKNKGKATVPNFKGVVSIHTNIPKVSSSSTDRILISPATDTDTDFSESQSSSSYPSHRDKNRSETFNNTFSLPDAVSKDTVIHARDRKKVITEQTWIQDAVNNIIDNTCREQEQQIQHHTLYQNHLSRQGIPPKYVTISLQKQDKSGSGVSQIPHLSKPCLSTQNMSDKVHSHDLTPLNTCQPYFSLACMNSSTSFNENETFEINQAYSVEEADVKGICSAKLDTTYNILRQEWDRSWTNEADLTHTLPGSFFTSEENIQSSAFGQTYSQSVMEFMKEESSQASSKCTSDMAVKNSSSDIMLNCDFQTNAGVSGLFSASLSVGLTDSFEHSGPDSYVTSSSEEKIDANDAHNNRTYHISSERDNKEYLMLESRDTDVNISMHSQLELSDDLRITAMKKNVIHKYHHALHASENMKSPPGKSDSSKDINEHKVQSFTARLDLTTAFYRRAIQWSPLFDTTTDMDASVNTACAFTQNQTFYSPDAILSAGQTVTDAKVSPKHIESHNIQSYPNMQASNLLFKDKESSEPSADRSQREIHSLPQCENKESLINENSVGKKKPRPAITIYVMKQEEYLGCKQSFTKDKCKVLDTLDNKVSVSTNVHLESELMTGNLVSNESCGNSLVSKDRHLTDTLDRCQQTLPLGLESFQSLERKSVNIICEDYKKSDKSSIRIPYDSSESVENAGYSGRGYELKEEDLWGMHASHQNMPSSSTLACITEVNELRSKQRKTDSLNLSLNSDLTIAVLAVPDSDITPHETVNSSDSLNISSSYAPLSFSISDSCIQDTLGFSSSSREQSVNLNTKESLFHCSYTENLMSPATSNSFVKYDQACQSSTSNFTPHFLENGQVIQRQDRWNTMTKQDVSDTTVDEYSPSSHGLNQSSISTVSSYSYSSLYDNYSAEKYSFHSDSLSDDKIHPFAEKYSCLSHSLSFDQINSIVEKQSSNSHDFSIEQMNPLVEEYSSDSHNLSVEQINSEKQSSDSQDSSAKTDRKYVNAHNLEAGHKHHINNSSSNYNKSNDQSWTQSSRSSKEAECSCYQHSPSDPSNTAAIWPDDYTPRRSSKFINRLGRVESMHSQIYPKNLVPTDTCFTPELSKKQTFHDPRINCYPGTYSNGHFEELNQSFNRDEPELIQYNFVNHSQKSRSISYLNLKSAVKDKENSSTQIENASACTDQTHSALERDDEDQFACQSQFHRTSSVSQTVVFEGTRETFRRRPEGTPEKVMIYLEQQEVGQNKCTDNVNECHSQKQIKGCITQQLTTNSTMGKTSSNICPNKVDTAGMEQHKTTQHVLRTSKGSYKIHEGHNKKHKVDQMGPTFPEYKDYNHQTKVNSDRDTSVCIQAANYDYVSDVICEGQSEEKGIAFPRRCEMTSDVLHTLGHGQYYEEDREKSHKLPRKFQDRTCLPNGKTRKMHECDLASSHDTIDVTATHENYQHKDGNCYSSCESQTVRRSSLDCENTVTTYSPHNACLSSHMSYNSSSCTEHSCSCSRQSNLCSSCDSSTMYGCVDAGTSDGVACVCHTCRSSLGYRIHKSAQSISIPNVNHPEPSHLCRSFDSTNTLLTRAVCMDESAVSCSSCCLQDSKDKRSDSTSFLSVFNKTVQDKALTIHSSPISLSEPTSPSPKLDTLAASGDTVSSLKDNSDFSSFDTSHIISIDTNLHLKSSSTDDVCYSINDPTYYSSCSLQYRDGSTDTAVCSCAQTSMSVSVCSCAQTSMSLSNFTSVSNQKRNAGTQLNCMQLGYSAMTSNSDQSNTIDHTGDERTCISCFTETSDHLSDVRHHSRSDVSCKGKSHSDLTEYKSANQRCRQINQRMIGKDETSQSRLSYRAHHRTKSFSKKNT